MEMIPPTGTNQNRMRAFVALELPDHAREFLNEMITVLKQTRADVRWSRSSSVHITLKFLGDIDVSQVPDIVRELTPVFAGQARFVIAISGLGVFPNLRQPRVVWAGLNDNSGHLRKMAGLVDSAFYTLGFKTESRPYSPHLTLGRTRSDEGKESLIELIKNMECKGPGFEVQTAKLFQSVLGPAGPKYSPISIFNIGNKDLV
jgi:RNA 2',3'-cyclic 3'-phosphodiesterase